MDGHEENLAEAGFNAGQNMNIHDGDALRLRFDDAEERLFQVDAGDGHARTASPPPGTVGAERWATQAQGGPATSVQTPANDAGGGLVGADAGGPAGTADDWTEGALRSSPGRDREEGPEADR